VSKMIQCEKVVYNIADCVIIDLWKQRIDADRSIILNGSLKIQ
jgi:hypothetical protein